MAAKLRSATRAAFVRGKKEGKTLEDQRAMMAACAIIILLLFLIFAQQFGWWPYKVDKLGTAFLPSNATMTSSDSGAAPMAPAPTAVAPAKGAADKNLSLADLAAGLDVGDSFASISAQAAALNPNCAVLADLSLPLLGTQKVCVFSEDDKLVTVTFLNDRVISASKAGF